MAVTGAGPPARPSDGSDEVDPELLSCLRHGQRREIVAFLYRRNGAASLTSLAPRMAAGEETSLAAMITTLHDLHLPKLESRGLIDYDPRTGTVTLTADPEAVEAALARSRDANE